MDRLPPYVGELLLQLGEARGIGWLDQNYRVMVGPPTTPIPGSPGQWLDLVARGFVGGERGNLILTELGREYADAEAKRRAPA